MQIGQHRLEKYSKVSTMYCWDEENTYIFLRLYYMYNLVQLRTNITLKEFDLNISFVGISFTLCIDIHVVLYQYYFLICNFLYL